MNGNLIISAQNYENLATPEVQSRISEVKQQWQNISYEQIAEQASAPAACEPSDSTSRAYVVEPDANLETDETNSIVLALPHLNGWTPHHYIRAKVLQQVVAPNSRVVVLPNEVGRKRDYDLSSLTDNQLDVLKNGNMRPLAEVQMRTIEKLDQKLNLGSVAISGYSFGARLGLSMAAVGSAKVRISSVNADEPPSEVERKWTKLMKDFSASGNGTDLNRAIMDSNIPALSTAMNLWRRNIGLAKFMLANFTPQGLLMQKAMSGSICSTNLLYTHRIPTKIGFVEGSKIFNPAFASPALAEDAKFVEYIGDRFHKHPSGDNVFLHALMAREGIKLESDEA